jgi:hypothetical protein
LYFACTLNRLSSNLAEDTSRHFKHLRKTRHTHHPVDDAIGNAEALLAAGRACELPKRLVWQGLTVVPGGWMQSIWKPVRAGTMTAGERAAVYGVVASMYFAGLYAMVSHQLPQKITGLDFFLGVAGFAALGLLAQTGLVTPDPRQPLCLMF